MNTNNQNQQNIPNQDRPALQNITESGVYRLRLCAPKPDKITETSDGAFTKLFFLGESGLCLSKKYSTQYPKALATLVGRLSNTYAKPLQEGSNTTAFLEYIKPALNKWADIELDATPQEWNGKTYYKYTFKKITAVQIEGSEQTNTKSQSTESDGVPF